MDYVIGVQAAAYPISATRFAIESAFGAHLAALKATMAPEFTRLVLIAPEMPRDVYEAQRAHLAVIDAADGIAFVPGPPADSSVGAFWFRHMPRTWPAIWKAIGNAGIYHTGMSSSIYTPFLFLTNIAAWLRRPPTVFFVDIDSRKNTERNFKTGVWSRRNYLVNKLVHDPFRIMQTWLATRTFDLCLLKSKALVADFGRGRPNVIPFLDTAHAPEAVLTPAQAQARAERVRTGTGALEVVYFGRLVAYKGLLLSLEAVSIARRRGADVRLRFIGAGDMLPALRQKTADLGMVEHVVFTDPVSYGPQLFSLLDAADVMVATPLIEDTPRAAIDAMARGLPVVAFDTEYFRDLSDLSGAVATGAWPSPEHIADRLVELQYNRSRLAGMSVSAVAFARDNTQDEWLRRRAAWVRKFCLKTG